jgi:glutamyl-tRNA synthetase/glutamyl-Q tRNA(Asp) synthetase
LIFGIKSSEKLKICKFSELLNYLSRKLRNSPKKFKILAIRGSKSKMDSRAMKRLTAIQGLPLVTRFAPSPTGFLHLGHVASAIFVWGIGRLLDAKIIVRIEDHDRQRCRKEYDCAILQDLDKLGFAPENFSAKERSEKNNGVSRQSDHPERYVESLKKLAESTPIYACSCTRPEVFAAMASQDRSELQYNGKCRSFNHPLLPHYGWRMEIDAGIEEFEDVWLGPQRQIPADQCGDLLLKDKNGNWTYQYSVVVDDVSEGVNLVIRGQDLIDSTGRQQILHRYLGSTQMPFFLHHPLILETGGVAKLSKRLASTSVRGRMLNGQSVESILGEAAWSVGLQAENRPLAQCDLVHLFSTSETALFEEINLKCV